MSLPTPDFTECRVVNIETTAGCNLECGYCSLRNRPVEFMPVDRLKKVLAAFKGCRPDMLVALYLGGEPLLNREFGALVLATKDAGFRIRIHTNGTVNRPGMWERLFDAGLTSVVFSVDGVDAADYQRLRGTPLAPIRAAIAACLSARSVRAGVTGRSEVSVGVLNLIEAPKSLVLNRGVADFRGLLDFAHVERPHSWLAKGSIRDASRCGENPQNPCFFSLNHMAVSVRGEVLPCCLCLNSEVTLGSLLEMTAREAWEGQMEAVRRGQRDGAPLHPCANCERYTPPGAPA